MIPREAPPPLEWHPWYANRTNLYDWLMLEGPYADYTQLRFPMYPRWKMSLTGERVCDETVMRTITMTRYRCHGPAPYVGRPFKYVWYVGVDDYGRCIAGESRTVYI